jgi:antirestriction protein
MEEEPRHEHHEHLAAEPPRIYAACLAAYNNGYLHGTWIRADQEPDEITAAITTMLQRSPQPGAEEWAIHDYEGFGPIHLSEYESIDTISRLGQGIAEHGPAFAHWAAYAGTDPDELDRFDEQYLGHWRSIEDYADELLDDNGIDTTTIGPEFLQPYIRFDLEAFAHDLEHELHVADDTDGVHIFQA